MTDKQYCAECGGELELDEIEEYWFCRACYERLEDADWDELIGDIEGYEDQEDEA